MTNVNSSVTQLMPVGGITNKGFKFGFLDSATKAAQHDTVTIKNAKEVIFALLTIDADGSEEAVTIATNVITCTDATTGAVSGFVIYR
jgi:hypothetical protein